MALLTAHDGSPTIQHPAFKELLHSRHGSVQESLVVYIQAGFEAIKDLPEINLLEMGFGSGLNVWLTYLHSLPNKNKIHFVSIDAYPLDETLLLQFWDQYAILHPLSVAEREQINQIIYAPWNQVIEVSPSFSLQKIKIDFLKFTPSLLFDLCYYDAFAPEAQPELWDDQAMNHLGSIIKKDGYVTSYCSKGVVQRNLKAAGFIIEKLPGPIGKREIIRAKKK